MSYEFTTDWFSNYIPLWQAVFRQYVPPHASILEIGSFEGRSTVWMIENSQPKEIICVDTWKGSWEHADDDMSAVERRFDQNVAIALKGRADVIDKIKAPSTEALAGLLSRGHAFDFIYLDGAHDTPTVLSDLVLSLPLCKVGGVICCDDYLWRWGDDRSPLDCPKMAIDSVVNCNYGRLGVIMGAPLYQIFLRKLA